MKAVLQAINTFMRGLGSIFTMIVVKAKIFDNQVDFYINIIKEFRVLLDKDLLHWYFLNVFRHYSALR